MEKNATNNEGKNEDEPKQVVRNAADLQRLKIEKLMKNPEKEVLIPERPKEKKLAPPPDFIRNVMGSSAGAGSGEFHVYRHLRRKEYSRQKFIQEQKERTRLDDAFKKKIEATQLAFEEKTAKKRMKRLKKKAKYKLAKKNKLSKQSNENECKQDESESDSSETDNDESTEDSPAEVNSENKEKDYSKAVVS